MSSQKSKPESQEATSKNLKNVSKDVPEELELMRKDDIPSDEYVTDQFISIDDEKLKYEPFSEEGIVELIRFFGNFLYSASSKEPRYEIAMQHVIQLFKKNYAISLVDNSDGILSPYYPPQIIFFEDKIGGSDSEKTMCIETIKERLLEAFLARCRQRFPVPVIYYKKRLVCRSSTLATGTEIVAREYLLAVKQILPASGNSEKKLELVKLEKDDGDKAGLSSEEQLSAAREKQVADVALLHEYNVNLIMDLMVENRKNKYWLYVTSSEKYEKDSLYHKEFSLASTPYPGCEFFAKYYGTSYEAKGMMFDWEDGSCDAEFQLPPLTSIQKMDIDWENYKDWDLVMLTQNYLKLIFNYLREEDTGILIHCISGWDRTPLFICLVRLSLWADGIIHEGLSSNEILYLTLAYDWMLFGHQFPVRLSKKEHILQFCFKFLKEIYSDEFSVSNYRPPSRIQSPSKKSPCKTPEKMEWDCSNDERDDLSRSRSPIVMHSAVTHALLEEKITKRVFINCDIAESVSPASIESDEPGKTDSPNSRHSRTGSSPANESDESNKNGFGKSAVAGDENVFEFDEEQQIRREEEAKAAAAAAAKASSSPETRLKASGSSETICSSLSKSFDPISICGSPIESTIPNTSRAQRLREVRELFDTCYYKALPNDITYKMPSVTKAYLLELYKDLSSQKK